MARVFFRETSERKHVVFAAHTRRKLSVSARSRRGATEKRHLSEEIILIVSGKLPAECERRTDRCGVSTLRSCFTLQKLSKTRHKVCRILEKVSEEVLRVRRIIRVVFRRTLICGAWCNLCVIIFIYRGHIIVTCYCVICLYFTSVKIRVWKSGKPNVYTRRFSSEVVKTRQHIHRVETFSFIVLTSLFDVTTTKESNRYNTAATFFSR